VHGFFKRGVLSEVSLSSLPKLNFEEVSLLESVGKSTRLFKIFCEWGKSRTFENNVQNGKQMYGYMSGMIKVDLAISKTRG
jgi:hypothetical protein